MRGHDERIRNSYHLVLRRSDTGDKRSLFDNVTRRFIQLNTVAQLERTHISNHQTGNNIPDNSTWPKRNYQSYKNRNALKYSGLGTGQVGINHRNHKSIEQKTDDVESWFSPIGIKAAYLQPLGFHLIGKVMDKTHQILHRIPYHKDSEQIGYILHNRSKDTLYRNPNIRKQLVCQALGLRKDGKQQRNRQ